eukprot:m.172681 g.172681  ORF g.172681 m.172681 type:complete len:259 (+) comp39084_c1_seq2:80-856(+)
MAIVETLLSLPLLEIFLALLLISFLGLYVFLAVTTVREPALHRYDSEKLYMTGKGDERRSFPSLDDPSSVSLSLIVPSYNEEKRLPTMLEEALEYLEERKKEDSQFSYEIIVVDDGSKDGTSRVALEYTKKYGHDKVRVLTFEKNRGKGGAVRMGMLSARGQHLLFADADGATKFSDFSNVEAGLKKVLTDENSPAIAVGSRAHLQDDAVAEPSSEFPDAWLSLPCLVSLRAWHQRHTMWLQIVHKDRRSASLPLRAH